MSEVKPCGHINTGVPCYCETPSPSTRAEAEPGGWTDADLVDGECGVCGAPDGKRCAEDCEWPASFKLSRSLPTPAPNREAELRDKIVDKLLEIRVGAFCDCPDDSLAAEGLCPWCEIENDLSALASLAQDEMKGEGKL